ncbi:cupin domain-containing protein [Herbiconiux sp. YIM B11900]|uniref:cupin domain-containing protein n=1 Tax=Herbiconiux sp. YIM B11900 TaxID=3404131 RepID=UPI003F871CF6
MTDASGAPGASAAILQPTALTVPLPHEPLADEQVVSGSPSTAVAELGRVGEVEFGLWEITPGVSTDVETDEVFVVLSGRATVEYTDADGPHTLTLGPGTIGRLGEGLHTTWTVTETLRKVYLLGAHAPAGA